MYHRPLRFPALPLVLAILCAAVAPRAEAQVSVLVDASRDGGVWWSPQGGPFDPNASHQGKALADFMRGQGLQVDELPRPTEVTCTLLSRYELVIVAAGCGSYTSTELSAYNNFVSAGGRLILLAEFFCEGAVLPASVGLGFSGSVFGPITTFASHAITAGVSQIPFIAGSTVVTAPPSATALGFISGAPVMGIMPLGYGQIFYMGDTNGIELLPQPFVSNLLGYMLGGAHLIPCVSTSCTTLLSPTPGAVMDNGCSDRSDNMHWDFDWTECPGATAYHLRVQHPGSLLPVIDNAALVSSHYAFDSPGSYIIDGNRFDWRWEVQAFVNGQWDAWTQERSFDVEPLNTDCSATPVKQSTWGELKSRYR